MKLETGEYNGQCVGIIRNHTHIILKCDYRERIYSIDVTSYNSTKCDGDVREVCSGLQPSVQQETNFCYMNRGCSVGFNDKTPIVKTSEERCIGRKPSRLSLSYNCVDKTVVHYPRLLHKGQNSTSERPRDKGVLVSHIHYPWHYSKGLSYESVLKPRNRTNTKLFISVPSLDLNGLNDTVHITNYSHNEGEDIALQKTDKGKAVLIRPSTELQTSVKFNTDQSIHSAKGFIICYCWVDEDTDLTDVDICTLLKATPTILKKKMRDGRRRKTGYKSLKIQKRKGCMKKQKLHKIGFPQFVRSQLRKFPNNVNNNRSPGLGNFRQPFRNLPMVKLTPVGSRKPVFV